MSSFVIDLEAIKMVFVVLGQTVAIIEILRRIQKGKFEELRKNIEESITARISSVLYEVDKLKTVQELRTTELEKEYTRSFTSVKAALADCVSLSVCHARMVYEDKMLGSLEKGLDKLGEKLDILTTFLVEERGKSK